MEKPGRILDLWAPLESTSLPGRSWTSSEAAALAERILDLWRLLLSQRRISLALVPSTALQLSQQ